MQNGERLFSAKIVSDQSVFPGPRSADRARDTTSPSAVGDDRHERRRRRGRRRGGRREVEEDEPIVNLLDLFALIR